jgi:hypothetical protein
MASSTASDEAFTQMCHHLSLSRTGKVQGAVDSLVLTVLAIDPDVGGSDANEVAQALSTYFSVELPLGEVRQALETHLRAGRLLPARAGGRITLSASARAEVEGRIEDAGKLEETVRREWLLEVAAAYPGLDGEALWGSLKAYLAAVFRQNGALAVELVRPGSDKSSGTGHGLPKLLATALKGCGTSAVPEASGAVTIFFRSSTPARTRYVSQLLDGTFTFFALSVSDATAEFLRGQLPSTRLFLDTNVILGILDLNENPMQEATFELLAFLKRHHLPYQLYCHERTLKELNELVEGASSKLLGARFSPALSRAVAQWSDRSTKLTGIERRYHALNALQPLDPKVFLSKFEHVMELLADKGVKLYRESPPELDVLVKGDYIAEFEHFLAQRHKERPYMARDHDIVVWMSLQRQRGRASNALKAGALLLTHDYALFDFDARFLRRKDTSHVATAVLPQQLIQVLRPLVGTKSDFDTRFVEVFAAPEFRTAQSDYDETASLVVSYLATYEDVSTETAVRVLSDEVLLAQLRPDQQTDAQFRELIENAVFKDNRSLLASVDDERHRAELADATTRSHERLAAEAAYAADEASLAAERFRSERDNVFSMAQDLDRQAAAQAVVLERTIEQERARALDAEGQLSKERARSRRYLCRARIALALALGMLGLIAIVFGPELFNWKTATEHENRSQISMLSGTAWLGLCWLVVKPKTWQVTLLGVVLASAFSLVTML